MVVRKKKRKEKKNVRFLKFYVKLVNILKFYNGGLSLWLNDVCVVLILVFLYGIYGVIVNWVYLIFIFCLFVSRIIELEMLVLSYSWWFCIDNYEVGFLLVYCLVECLSGWKCE